MISRTVINSNLTDKGLYMFADQPKLHHLVNNQSTNTQCRQQILASTHKKDEGDRFLIPTTPKVNIFALRPDTIPAEGQEMSKA